MSLNLDKLYSTTFGGNGIKHFRYSLDIARSLKLLKGTSIYFTWSRPGCFRLHGTPGGYDQALFTLKK